MVGDSLIKDIKGAQDYGLKTIWVNRNRSMTEDIKPDYEIADLTKIHDILTSMPDRVSSKSSQLTKI
jgi:putative hydrolase of the HAD superfamily